MATTINGDTGVSKVQDDIVTEDKLNLISTSSVPSLEAKGSGSQDGYIQLNCYANTHGIKLKSPPHSAGASYTLTFPNNDGDADQFLQTNGSGVMSWAAAGGGFTNLGTVTVSGSPTSLTFSGINCSEHNFLVFMLSGLTSASTANPVFKLGSLNATTGDWMAGDLGTTNTTEGMIWLDTTTNRGIIYTTYNFPVVSAGNTGYGGSQPHTMLYSQGSNIQLQTSASIVWSLAGGVAFTAGSIKLYGVS